MRIIRFHTCSKQRRIKAVVKETDNSSETTYSIPLNHHNPMFICDENRLGKEKVWKPLLLEDIVRNHKLPLTVRFASPDTCEDVKSSRISTLTLTEGYDESFLLGNIIENGCLQQRIIYVPVKDTGMKVALVSRMQGRSSEEWSQYITELNDVGSSISFNHWCGPFGINLYNPKPTDPPRHRLLPLQSVSQHLGKLFQPSSFVSRPELDKTCTFFHSTTETDWLLGDT
ncbi:hypothetical protein CHS0354_013686 [Potamilus streckersoni]|uniref:Uncharacterized protein n=1 Tax=Potamilus streckersoni TaxID=2493646 RepID=A0AAE0VHA4_9BIVA|nr:hypothetical protein CHS0354_013686 [Potamilus streckersoni]